ncbi:MAG: hypothetical protein V3U06_01500, partial [Candidatus Binatia bacterium]
LLECDQGIIRVFSPGENNPWGGRCQFRMARQYRTAGCCVNLTDGVSKGEEAAALPFARA